MTDDIKKIVRNNNIQRAVSGFSFLSDLSLDDKVEAINEIRLELSKVSPFRDEPVDCVLWKKSEIVTANDYNPNAVAPPEMELLTLSIRNDGYTQPIVTDYEDGVHIVIDGFHRSRVCKETEEVRNKVHGYAPIVQIKQSQAGRADRIASTIRHNRARGKHKVESMSDIVLELKRRNWSDKKISKQLGMDQDEVLRLAQITGLLEALQGEEFSKAWVPEDFEEVEEIDG